MRPKVVEHPAVGRIALDCDTLVVAADDLRIMIYPAEPGTADAERLALAVVLGAQSLVEQSGRNGRPRAGTAERRLSGAREGAVEPLREELALARTQTRDTRRHRAERHRRGQDAVGVRREHSGEPRIDPPDVGR